MKKNRRAKFISITVFLLFAVLFVAKFGGPSILKLYIETGMGGCREIPILCREPDEGIVELNLNKEYLVELHPYKFPQMEIAIPSGFEVYMGVIKKGYYAKEKGKDSGASVYLFYEPPGFFTDLFPKLKKQGGMDNYEFIRRAMSARLNAVNNITDVFFVIMKGVFTPDLAKQDNLRMVEFKLSGKRGFINYNLSGQDNYFDCNVISNQGDFFKVYIKDKGATLDLNQVLAIVSMAKKAK